MKRGDLVVPTNRQGWTNAWPAVVRFSDGTFSRMSSPTNAFLMTSPALVLGVEEEILHVLINGVVAYVFRSRVTVVS